MLDEGKRAVGLKAFEAWKAAGMRNTVELATGMGKTFVFLDAARHCKEVFGSRCKVLFLAEVNDRDRELTKDALFYESIYGDVLPTIEFACYQSAYKYEKKHYSLVGADEIHDSLTPSYSAFYRNNTYNMLIGLSATVSSDVIYEMDGEEKSKMQLLNEIAPVCFTYGIEQAIKEGHSRKLRVDVIHHRLDDTIKNVKMGTIAQPFMQTEKKAYKHYDDRFWSGIFADRKFDVQRYMGLRAKLIYSLPSKIKASKDILKVLKGRTLLFGNDLDTLETITPNVIRAARTGEKKRERDEMNEKIRSDFENGVTDIIGSFKMLKQGANIRGGLDTVMIVSYYGKSVDWIQRIGRLRKDGDKEGRIIIFVTLATQEEKWFKKMVDKIDMSVFNVVKHADAESFIKTYNNGKLVS